MKKFCILSATTLMSIHVTKAAVSFGKKCMEKICGLDEFCSDFRHQCEQCSSICLKETHNFDEITCVKECQDYLLNQRFMQSSTYKGDIRRLEKQQIITMIIVIIILFLFILIHGTKFVRWLKKREFNFSLECLKTEKKKEPIGITVENPNTQSPRARPRLEHINSAASTIYSVSAVGGSTVHTVSTPISRRIPGEDSTLDFSYDNGGLVVTPESDRMRGSEATF